MIINLNQRSNRWLEWREGGIGGSEIGAIMGLNPYKTASKLFKERTGQIKKPDFSRNPDVQRGVNLEDTIRQEAQRRHFSVFSPLCFQHDQKSYARYSSDGISFEDSMLIEIKSPRTLPEEARVWEVCQCQWGMGISRISKTLLVYQTSNGDFKEFEFEFDKDYFDHCLTIAEKFWQSIENYSSDF